MLITDCPNRHRHLADCTKDCAEKCGAPGGCKEHKHCTSCNAILCHRGLWYRLPEAPYDPGTPESAYAEMTRAQAQADRWRELWEQAKEHEAQMQAAREAAIREVEEQRAEAFREVSEQWQALMAAWTGPARAALILHQPRRGGGDLIECAHCVECDGYENVDQVEWPCETYKVMEEAVSLGG